MESLRGMRVAYLPVAPYIEISDSPTVKEIGGILIHVIKAISTAMKFNYTLSMPRDKVFGMKLPNNSWSGLMGMLLRNETDMILGVIGINELRFQYVRFTDGYYESKLSLLASADPPEPMGFFSLLLTFDVEIWYLLFISFFGVILGTSITDSLHNMSMKNIFHRLGHNFWLYLQTMFCEGSSHVIPTRISQFVLAIWLLAVLVLTNCFSSQFKALLMVEDDGHMMETVSDLAARVNVLPSIASGSMVAELFQNSDQKAYQTVNKRIQMNKEETLIPSENFSYYETYHKVVTGKFVLMGDYSTLKAYVSKYSASLRKKRKLYFFREALITYQAALAFRFDYNATFVNAINLRIFWLREAGLVDRWMDESTRDFWKVEQSDSSQGESPLGFKHILPVFFMLAELELCCLVVLIVELVYTAQRRCSKPLETAEKNQIRYKFNGQGNGSRSGEKNKHMPQHFKAVATVEKTLIELRDRRSTNRTVETTQRGADIVGQ